MRDVTVRMLRRQRMLAVGAIGYGLGWAVVGRVTGDAGLATFVPALVLLAGSAVVIFRGPSRERMRIDPAVPAMYAPARGPASFPVFALAWLAFQLVHYGGRWERDLFWWTMVTVSTALMVVLAVDLWRRVPLIALTPDGITSGGPRAEVFVPWSALAAGQPGEATAPSPTLLLPLSHPQTAELSTLALPLARPELVRRRGRRWRGRSRWWRGRPHETLVLHEVDAAPEFLAVAVRYYLDHPEHRAGLGTVEEFARLPRALGGHG
ncbi:hypothetical protein [Micromonospora cathayae]|uniref:PH domain-containing protein n=1 Tax=Micromonospora cathayae TaxID=3028804 RepID=A0ABY7ZXD4_9ACTN|nr:hypothetical protein [Micromonospora sp. HUAS 3]WDZ86663.1 hypothetical protein PVK37_09840 [Micromonospora sp. HUAS 3]